MVHSHEHQCLRVRVRVLTDAAVEFGDVNFVAVAEVKILEEVRKYRSGMINSKSLVGSVLFRIKWKFELTVYFKHEILGQL